MISPPPGYLVEVQRLCRESGTLLIVDEVQTGLGRTGPLFAVEDEAIEPDIMTLAKSLGGGMMPLGAMIARRDHWLKAYGSYQTFALHSSTFSGGSLACAAGLAALRCLSDPELQRHVAEVAARLQAGLAEIARESPIIKEARGRGLMLGLEFHELDPSLFKNFLGFNASGQNWWLVPGHRELLRTIPAIYVQAILLNAHSIYTQVARSNPRVLRIQPPLVITMEEVERFLEALKSACVEWSFISQSADAILTKNVGSMEVR